MFLQIAAVTAWSLVVGVPGLHPLAVAPHVCEEEFRLPIALWLEAWVTELDEQGDLLLEEYARLHHLPLDVEAYRREFPEDVSLTEPDVSAE